MIIGIENKGDKTIVKHMEDVAPVWERNYHDRKDMNKGFTPNRETQRIGRVPMAVWIEWTKKYPELIFGDRETKDKLTVWLLNNVDDGRYKTVEGGI